MAKSAQNNINQKHFPGTEISRPYPETENAVPKFLLDVTLSTANLLTVALSWSLFYDDAFLNYIILLILYQMIYL